ncbi:MAG: hypothetical protein U0289_17755 [Cyclobacteriaceae bacterium]
MNTEEGRIVMTGANPEYQYHLKDHLGNVRTTFTTVTTPEVNTANYEDANLNTELATFARRDKVRRVNSTLFDRTNGSSPGFSERLNGTTNEKYGLARSIAVSSGDVVSAEVYAKYPDTNSANWLPALSTLMGNIATNTGNIVVDGSNYANGNNPFNALFAQAHTPNGTAPQAYLNWMVFDKNWNLISSKSGYMQITTAGRETGSDVAHERLFTPSISITEPGYVYIYVSNEDLAAPKDVFFDDFSVTQVKTPIVQVEDYYPFGLRFNEYVRDSSLPNKIKLFQGQEHVEDLGLNWDSFKWRNDQPDIGRFFNVDPLSEKYYYNSPYAFSENKVTAHVELEGLESRSINFLTNGESGRLEAMAQPLLREAKPTGPPTAGDKILNGTGNIVFGTAGAVGSGLGIGATEGAGAAFGLGTAFTLSLATATMGITQVVDGVNELATGEVSSSSEAIQGSSNLIGLAATGSEHHELFNAAGGLLPNNLTGGIGGNLKAITNGISGIGSSQGAVKTTVGVLNAVDAVIGVKSAGGAVLNANDNKTPVFSGEKISQQKAEEIKKFVDKLPNQ